MEKDTTGNVVVNRYKVCCLISDISVYTTTKVVT